MGKTFLAHALGHIACHRGKSVVSRLHRVAAEVGAAASAGCMHHRNRVLSVDRMTIQQPIIATTVATKAIKPTYQTNGLRLRTLNLSTKGIPRIALLSNMYTGT
ncbi:MAG: hypothetical protein KBD01_13640 [Acidobacteria bacterium]|nr:hypothetical protein [Acidobacteriota bacterium]